MDTAIFCPPSYRDPCANLRCSWMDSLYRTGEIFLSTSYQIHARIFAALGWTLSTAVVCGGTTLLLPRLTSCIKTLRETASSRAGRTWRPVISGGVATSGGCQTIRLVLAARGSPPSADVARAAARSAARAAAAGDAARARGRVRAPARGALLVAGGERATQPLEGRADGDRVEGHRAGGRP